MLAKSAQGAQAACHPALVPGQHAEGSSKLALLIETLEEALRRFETGCYLVWYPIVQRAEALELPARLLRLGSPSGPARWLRAELRVRAPPAGGYGLYGSGMFVINPPWTLPAVLQDLLPWLARRLALDERASQSLQFRLP